MKIPSELVGAFAGEQNGLLGEIGHAVLERVREVHGVMDSRVMELHVDGVVLFVVVAAHDTHRVPDLRTHTTTFNSQSDKLLL